MYILWLHARSLTCIRETDIEFPWGPDKLRNARCNSHVWKSQSKILNFFTWQGAFSICQKFWKFQLGCKLNTTFWFVLLDIFRNKRNIWKGSPFFPVETSQWKLVFHLQISGPPHQSQAFRGIFRALLQLRWRFSLLTPEFTMNYTNAKKCFSRRIVGFPNDCRCGTLPVVWTCLHKASVVSFAILKWLLNSSIAIEYAGNEHS